MAAKAAVIARTPQLAAALGEGAQASAEGVSSGCYNLVAGQSVTQQLQCAAQLAAYHSCRRGCVEVRFTMQLHTACGLMLQKL